MKNPILWAFVFLMLLSSCKKTVDAVAEKEIAGNAATIQFTKYTIRQGQHYCDQNKYKTVETGEMKFVVKFDSTAVYQTESGENQNDINKLLGFSDNNSDHHQYSARFGWRWSKNALRLFAYVYNEGVRTSKELTTIAIGANITCSIKISGSYYLFTVNGVEEKMPRMASTAKAKGYQLYPYFGGDEAAPHDIAVWIRMVE